MFRKTAPVLILGLIIALFTSPSVRAEDAVQATLPSDSTPAAPPVAPVPSDVSAPTADSSESLPQDAATEDRHSAAPPPTNSAIFEVTRPSYDARLADKATRSANAGFVIAPAVLLLSSLPYLAFMGDPTPDYRGAPLLSDRTLKYAPVIVPLVSAAALTNLIASSVVIVRGARARKYYGVPGSRAARVLGVTLFVLSYLPAFAGPFGLEWVLPPVCGLLGGVGLLSLAHDNLTTARQAQEKIKGEGIAPERKTNPIFAPTLAPVPTKDGVTGLTVGLRGTF